MRNDTVLVVDDEPHIRYMLELKLTQAGMTVITAQSGLEAYELAVKHRPCIVITDLQMPELDGMELCVKLRENPETAHIPTLMLTARGHRLSTEDLQRTNVRVLMDKPFSPRQLLAKIRELMVVSNGEHGKQGEGAAAA